MHSSACCLNLGLTLFGQKFYELLNGKHAVNIKNVGVHFSSLWASEKRLLKSDFSDWGHCMRCPRGRHINSTICTHVHGKLREAAFRVGQCLHRHTERASAIL